MANIFTLFGFWDGKRKKREVDVDFTMVLKQYGGGEPLGFFYNCFILKSLERNEGSCVKTTNKQRFSFGHQSSWIGTGFNHKKNSCRIPNHYWSNLKGENSVDSMQCPLYWNNTGSDSSVVREKNKRFNVYLEC